MAQWIALTDQTLSTSAGNWNQIDFLSWDVINHTGQTEGTHVEDFYDTQTVPVTFGQVGDQQGIVIIYNRNLESTTAVLTVKLQEFVDPDWVERTSNDFTLTNANFPLEAGMKYLALDTWTVTTDAGIWRYVISCDVNNALQGHWNTTTKIQSLAAVLDNMGKPAANDMIFIGNDVTLTVDEACAFDHTGTSDSQAIVMCHGSSFYVPEPAAGFTITLNGFIFYGQTGNIRFGTSGTPITAANQVHLDHSASTTAALFITFTTSALSLANRNESYTTFYIALYGEKPNYLSRLDGQVEIAGEALTTEDDMSGDWSVDDVLILVGADRNNRDLTTEVIASISGTTINLDDGVAYLYFDKSGVINQTVAEAGMGIKFTGRTADTSNFYAPTTKMDYFIISGCYLLDVKINYGTSTGYRFNNWNANCAFDTVMFYNTNDTNDLDVGFVCRKSMDITDTVLVGYNAAVGSSSIFRIYCSGGTWSRIFLKNLGSSNYIQGTNITASKLAWFCGTGSAGVQQGGINSNVSDSLFVAGSGGGRAIQIGTYDFTTFTYDDCIFESRDDYTMLSYNCVGTFKDCTFSVNTAGSRAIAEHYVVSGMLVKLLFNNCLWDTIEHYNLDGLGTSGTSKPTLGTYIRYHKYQQTADDHRTFYIQGTSVTTKAGFADTTVHTAGGIAYRDEALNDDAEMAWEQIIPTGDIQNTEMMVGVWCKLNHANYYAGTHVMPRLTINYDDGTTAYAQAAQTTDWQFLAVPFTPVTTYGQIKAKLSGTTDDTGSDSYVYWDDYSVLYPAGYQLNLGSLDVWADGLPAMPTIATNLSAQDVWAVATSTLTGAGTIGKRLKNLKSMLEVG